MKMSRRWEKDWTEKNKDKPGDKKGKKIQLGAVEMFALLCVFGLPVGSVWLIAMNTIAKNLLTIIPH